MLPAYTIQQLDERLAVEQKYTTISILDMYPSGVLSGKNVFTAVEGVLRYEANYN